MNTRQQRIVHLGAVLLLALNAFYAAGLNYITNSVQHTIGPDVVSIYVPTGEAGDPLVPIQRIPSFERTGQSVGVYLHNNYCAGEGSARPTLVLLVVLGALYFLAGRTRALDGPRS